MQPIPDGFVPAYSTATGEKRWVPPHWLDDKGPFAGQWRKTPKAAAAEAAAQDKSETTGKGK